MRKQPPPYCDCGRQIGTADDPGIYVGDGWSCTRCHQATQLARDRIEREIKYQREHVYRRDKNNRTVFSGLEPYKCHL